MAHVHVIGAGLAGLACAVRLRRAGVPVTVHEAAPHAGGRCRSYWDARLERTVDNGNHMVLSANTAALAYLDDIGARHTLSAPPGAYFPFVDLASGARWTLRPTPGPIPWWILMPRRRVAGTGAGHYLRALRLMWARPEQSVADVLQRPGDPLWARLWRPLTAAILNTEPEAASARLLRGALVQTLARGAARCRPLTPVASLSETFVDPALALLARAGTPVCFGRRLRCLEVGADGVTGLDFADTRVPVGAGDIVVLAVPAPPAAALLPGLTVPTEMRPIVNAHIRLPHRARLAEGIPFLGLVGGTAEWLFLRQDVASVTVSAANGLVDRPAAEIADLVWADTARALALDARLRPPIRVIKERRATIAQTPAALRRRPGTQTALANLLLAGAWTDTGLPATIEGAVASGHKAAAAALRRL